MKLDEALVVRFAVRQRAEINETAARHDLSRQQVIRLAVDAGLPVVNKVIGELGEAGLAELERFSAERKAS